MKSSVEVDMKMLHTTSSRSEVVTTHLPPPYVHVRNKTSWGGGYVVTTSKGEIFSNGVQQKKKEVD